jgi:hypothetical protein
MRAELNFNINEKWSEPKAMWTYCGTFSPIICAALSWLHFIWGLCDNINALPSCQLYAIFSLFFNSFKQCSKKWCLSYPGLPKKLLRTQSVFKQNIIFFRSHSLKHLIMVSVYDSFETTNWFISETNGHNLMIKHKQFRDNQERNFFKKNKNKRIWDYT